MRILKIYGSIDHPSRYNYAVNYGVWDAIEGDSTMTNSFNHNLDNYDVVFLPTHSRWKGHERLLDKIKNHRIGKILFDNDSCYRSFADPFYEGMDYIFYRCPDMHGDTPVNGSFLPWSVDVNRFTPQYGGRGVAFPCTVDRHYPLRREIARILPNQRIFGDEYVRLLQKSAGAVHTNSHITGVVRAKALEYAACGTHIISNRCWNMASYFDDELITYFDNVDDLKDIISNFTPNERIQRMLRKTVECYHSHDIRAKEILSCV
jgi:hypothetical protein